MSVRVFGVLASICLALASVGCDSDSGAEANRSSTAEGSSKDESASTAKTAKKHTLSDGPIKYASKVQLGERFPGEVGALAFGSAGKFAYAGAKDEGVIAVLSRDSSSGELSMETVVSDVDGLGGIDALAISPDGSQLAAVTARAPTFREYDAFLFDRDASSGDIDYVETVKRVALPEISPDGDFGYQATGSDTIEVLDRGDVWVRFTKSGEHKVDMAKDHNVSQTRKLHVSPDGKNLYVATQEAHRTDDEIKTGTWRLIVYARDKKTGSLEQIQSLLDGENGVEIKPLLGMTASPDGHRLYAVTERLAVFARDPDNGKLTWELDQRRPADEGSYFVGPVFVPEAGHLYSPTFDHTSNEAAIVHLHHEVAGAKAAAN